MSILNKSVHRPSSSRGAEQPPGMEKTVSGPRLLLAALILPGATFCQYGGYVPTSGSAVLLPGSVQVALRDTTTNNGSLTAADSSATVTLSGSAANSQHVLNGSSATYSQVGRLVLNNGSGGLVLATGSYGLQVLGNLTFASAASKVVTPRTALARTTNNLQLASGATLSGADSSHSVDGYLQKIGGQGFTFPLSQANVYAPLAVTGIGAGNTLTAAYFASAYPDITVPPGVTSISNLEYWDLAAKGSPSAVLSVTLGNDYPDYQAANTTLVGWNIASNAWEAIATTTPSAVIAGTIISSSVAINLANYSAFTIASTSASTTSAIRPSIAAEAVAAPTIVQPDAQAYPNPTTGMVSVSVSGTGNYVVSVYDQNGRRLQQTSTTGGNTLQLDLGNLSNGMYHISVADKNNNIIKTIKIIKNR